MLTMPLMAILFEIVIKKVADRQKGTAAEAKIIDIAVLQRFDMNSTSKSFASAPSMVKVNFIS